MDQLLFPSNSMTRTHWTWNKSSPNRSIILLPTNWASHTSLLPWTKWFFLNTSFFLLQGAPAAVSTAPKVASEGVGLSGSETLLVLILRSCCWENGDLVPLCHFWMWQHQLLFSCPLKCNIQYMICFASSSFLFALPVRRAVQEKDVSAFAARPACRYGNYERIRKKEHIFGPVLVCWLGSRFPKESIFSLLGLLAE